jgi:hypothetical protein
MSSFLVFEHKPGHCAMNKLIGAERLFTMSILHYYHQRHMSWKLLSTADENLRAGYHLYSEPRVRLPSTPIPKIPLFPSSPSTLAILTFLTISKPPTFSHLPPQDPLHIPPCWEEIVERNRKEQAILP